MQKFVRSQKYESITKVAPPPPPLITAAAAADSKNKETTMKISQVKLSGYLKKKRNKVGGWRKMWFVLQDKLLLSYASKEEYDNKLVSFKDVLNLVPGTIVRPLGGFRFTIETTTETMYTFRCDDSKICTEWITGLLDSLSNKNSNCRLKSRQIFHNVSLENIQLPSPYAGAVGSVTNKAIRFSYSCDSISRTATKAKNYPRIPIAHATARILERNGLSADDLQQLLRNKQNCDTQNAKKDHNSAPNNFRLHNNNNNNYNSKTSTIVSSQMHSTPFRHQLNTVTRINRMFERFNPEAATSSDSGSSTVTEREIINDADTIQNNNNNSNNNNNCIKSNVGSMKMNEKSKRHFEDDSNETRIFDNKFLPNGDSGTCGIKHQHNALDSETLRSQISNRSYCEKNKECDTTTIVEDQIYRMSPSLLVSAVKRKSSPITKDELSSPVYATINPPICTSNSTFDGVLSECKSDENSPDGLQTSSNDEPIYAVIDLKSKHALRAKKKVCKNTENLLQQQRSANERNHPKSLQAIKSDYEEVLNLSEESLYLEQNGDDLLKLEKDKYCHEDNEEEEENIYEPIHIPERKQTTSQRHSIWKYFSRLNIDALLEMTRKRKNDLKVTSSEKSITATAATATAAIEQNTTTLSDIRRKLGKHRKSIKFQMKKLYTRDHQPMPLHKHHRKAFSNDDLQISNVDADLIAENRVSSSSAASTSSNISEFSLKSDLDSMKPTTAALVMAEIEKYRRGKKPLFGSLSRLRQKTRASLNFVAEEGKSGENIMET